MDIVAMGRKYMPSRYRNKDRAKKSCFAHGKVFKDVKRAFQEHHNAKSHKFAVSVANSINYAQGVVILSSKFDSLDPETQWRN